MFVKIDSLPFITRNMNEETQAARRQNTKRKQIIETAFKLFTENGFYATGVDLIMRESKISKRTMYIYFPTKNELIVAVLQYYRANYQQKLNEILKRDDIQARQKIMLIFEESKSWFGSGQFHGCLAVNAMGEFAGKDTAIETACQVFKTWELSVFMELCKELPVMYPQDLAFKLLVLIEGLGAIAQVMQQPCPIDITQMVYALLDEHYID